MCRSFVDSPFYCCDTFGFQCEMIEGTHIKFYEDNSTIDVSDNSGLHYQTLALRNGSSWNGFWMKDGRGDTFKERVTITSITKVNAGGAAE